MPPLITERLIDALRQARARTRFHQADIRGGDGAADIHIGPEIRSRGRLPRLRFTSDV